MNQRTEYWTWLSCFLVGSIAGAGAALLLAPESGRETRGRVGRKLRRAARAARDLNHRVLDPDSALAGNGGRREKRNEDAPPSP
jgi:gas vesicle protein